MKAQTNIIHRALVILLLCIVTAVPALAADGPRFRPASDVQPVIGRYLVALATDDVVEGGRTSDLLARTYGGRLEPFAHDGLAGPMIVMVMRPAQARALSNDPRVLWVEERPLVSERIEPAPIAPARPSPAVRKAAVTRTPDPHSDVTDNSWSSGTYEYDSAGNIKKIGDDIYRYDKFGRLARATAGTAPVASGTTPVNEQNFNYDTFGNLTSLTTKTATGTMSSGFAVNADTNQLNGVCPGGVDRCLSGIYDPAGSGNQVGLTQSDQYTWDPLGMMTELHDRRYERYVYDANDERILTIDVTPRPSSVETHRRYTLRGPDNKVLRELTHTLSTNTWSAAKDYVYRGGTLIASFPSAAIDDPDRHFHTDHLGSTRVVSDGDAHRLAVHTYWPFGGEADGSQTDTERMKFTGHERDGAGSGFELDYMHARFYDANLGRFLSVDPGRDWDMRQPQSWNVYTYVRNKSINQIDPTGKCSEPADFIGPTTLCGETLHATTISDVIRNEQFMERYVINELEVGFKPSIEIQGTDVEAGATLTHDQINGDSAINASIRLGAVGASVHIPSEGYPGYELNGSILGNKQEGTVKPPELDRVGVGFFFMRASREDLTIGLSAGLPGVAEQTLAVRFAPLLQQIKGQMPSFPVLELIRRLARP